ncbi:hypothetical protein E2C01_028506 [Portunus trituberculatus]|uniref:Uncharacterized protein n=1 Tax=Portunus trituberculatus TaxID=210409 RepID=A0A5B7ELQ2_PORTR|nr:hypothetical protein [Portunus trituberculatus]
MGVIRSVRNMGKAEGIIPSACIRTAAGGSCPCRLSEIQRSSRGCSGISLLLILSKRWKSNPISSSSPLTRALSSPTRDSKPPSPYGRWTPRGQMPPRERSSRNMAPYSSRRLSYAITLLVKRFYFVTGDEVSVGYAVNLGVSL